MRIALIAPQWNELINSYPPLGLGYLAAVAEAEGHAAAIFDFGLDPSLTAAQAVDRVAAFGPDLVGVTAMTNNYHSAQALMAETKRRLECPIVVGGPHATLFPERVVGEACVDYVISGEGEETFRDLVRALGAAPTPSAENLRSIAGLCFTAGGRIVTNPQRALIRDLDALPFPARHLYELERYSLVAPSGERMVTVLSSRGCPYNCSYCFKGIVGRTYRQRSPESVIAELKLLVDRYGYRHFYFIDDLFTLDRRRLEDLTTRIIEERLDIRWQCLARVDRVTPDLLRRMYRSGCREVHYGIESGNAEILAQLGKDITKDQVRQAVRATTNAGIAAKGYFMLGLPGDTEETMEQTIAFAAELELEQAMFSLTTPFPGTRLWDEAVARYPDLEQQTDFARAYYYVANQDGLIAPFLNVSQVGDDRLSQLAFLAQERFQEAKRKRKYDHALGRLLGGALYGLSNIGAIRQLGRTLVRTKLASRIRGVNKLGDYDLRKELEHKWV